MVLFALASLVTTATSVAFITIRHGRAFMNQTLAQGLLSRCGVDRFAKIPGTTEHDAPPWATSNRSLSGRKPIQHLLEIH